MKSFPSAEDAFALVTDHDTSFLTIDKTLDALRLLGFTPSEKEAREELELIEIAKEDPSEYNYRSNHNSKAHVCDSVSLSDFKELAKAYTKKGMTMNGLISCFKMFDPGEKGYINAADLRSVLTTVGEKLTDGELKRFMELADPNGNSEGKIDYKAVAKLLISDHK